MGSHRARPDPLYAVFAQLRELWRDLARHGAEPFVAGGKFSPDVARRLVEVAEAIRRSSADQPDGEQQDG